MDRLRGNTPEAQQAQAEEAEAWRAVLHPEGLVKPPSEKDMAALFLEAQAERIGDKVAAAAGQVLPTAAKGTADGEEKEKSADFDAGKEEAKGGAGGDAPTPTDMEVVDGELSTENVVEPAAMTSSKGSVRRGEEMTVPARTRHTSFFFVEKGATLSWSFRVAYLSVHLNQPLSIGFAVKLRIQGDGGSSEVQIMFQAPLFLFLDTNEFIPQMHRIDGIFKPTTNLISFIFLLSSSQVDVFDALYQSGVTVHGEWSPRTTRRSCSSGTTLAAAAEAHHRPT